MSSLGGHYGITAGQHWCPRRTSVAFGIPRCTNRNNGGFPHGRQALSQVGTGTKSRGIPGRLNHASDGPTSTQNAYLPTPFHFFQDAGKLFSRVADVNLFHVAPDPMCTSCTHEPTSDQATAAGAGSKD